MNMTELQPDHRLFISGEFVEARDDAAFELTSLCTGHPRVFSAVS